MNFKSMNALHFITVTAFLSVFGFTVLKTQPADATTINFSLDIQPIDVCDKLGVANKILIIYLDTGKLKL